MTSFRTSRANKLSSRSDIRFKSDGLCTVSNNFVCIARSFRKKGRRLANANATPGSCSQQGGMECVWDRPQTNGRAKPRGQFLFIDWRACRRELWPIFDHVGALQRLLVPFVTCFTCCLRCITMCWPKTRFWVNILQWNKIVIVHLLDHTDTKRCCTPLRCYLLCIIESAGVVT